MTSGPTTARKRVLFIAEAVTLAHVARPVVLASHLPADRFETILAADPRYESLYAGNPLPRVAIQSIPSARFTQALARGTPIYDSQTLLAYVQDDLKLLAELKPDVVVGDMRLTLAVSARLAGVPYIALSNAYWSPCARLTYPLPDLPLTKLTGRWLGQRLFNLARPLAFALHTLPMRRVYQRHGFSTQSLSLQKVYTEADLTLYADLPGLTPMVDPLPAGHQFLGPVLWEPDLPLPDWWHDLPMDRPWVYVNLGSSGPGRLLPQVLQGLADLPVTAIAATAGKAAPPHIPPNARIADFLPGQQACDRAALVICNGGSPATQQAIAAGKPMLCLPSNLDQCLNTQGVVSAGAADLLRAGRLTPALVQAKASSLLGDPSFTKAARALKARLDDIDIHQAFLRHIDAMTSH